MFEPNLPKLLCCTSFFLVTAHTIFANCLSLSALTRPLVRSLQETYVVFGTSETDRSGSEVRVPCSGAQTASAAATGVQRKVVKVNI